MLACMRRRTNRETKSNKNSGILWRYVFMDVCVYNYLLLFKLKQQFYSRRVSTQHARSTQYIVECRRLRQVVELYVYP